MDCKYLSFKETGAFSHNDTSYIQLDEKLREFYLYEPNIQNFESVIKQKEKSPINRTVLYDVLIEQYANLSQEQNVLDNIELLKLDNTFTITTAHQPSLFTGPLYYIYKIVSTINLCKKLSETYPEYNFVPIFWSGGEDHDFEEINHVKVFNHELVWENNEKGSVAGMKLDGIKPVIQQLKEILGESENANHIVNILESAYGNNNFYGKFSIELTHELFKDKGLVIIDSGHKYLKQIATPLFKKEILERKSESIVKKTQERFVERGFKAQAFARPINLFFTGLGGFRKRIDYQNGKYIILDKDIEWTEEEIMNAVEESSYMFSPNVVIRPLYQEMILPNLAYIGGGGELAYWLERKEQFEYFGIPYPMLIRRDSVLWIDKGSDKKLNKLGLDINTIWSGEESIIKNHVKEILDEEIDITNEKNIINETYATIISKITQLDPTLKGTVESELSKTLKGIENIEKKVIKSSKRKHEVNINQIRGLKNKLFPQGNLQERKDNFIPLYLKYGEEFFDMLYKYLDPMDRRIKVIIEND